MKLKSILKKSSIFGLAIIALALNGCGSGNTSSNTKTLGGLDGSSKIATQNMYMNFYNSLFLSQNINYSYQLMDQSGNVIKDGIGNSISGTFTCNGPTSCNTESVPMDNQTQYLVSVWNKDSNTFVGGAVIAPQTSYTASFIVNIDDTSTSAYLNTLLSNKLTNSFNGAIIQSRLFLPALSYEPGKSLNDILYLYFIYLTKTNNKSYSDAISTLTTVYQQCENQISCSIDSNFINNPAVVRAAENNLTNTINQYNKDKNDAQLYLTYQNIKNAVNTINSGVNLVTGLPGNPIDKIVDGASGKIKSGIGGISQLIDPIFNSMGLQDSLAAYNRMQSYNQLVNSYFVAAIPNYAAVQNQLTSTMMAASLSTDYNNSMNAILTSYYDVLNHFASFESVNYYIASESSSPRNLDWMVASDGTNGHFGSTNAQARTNAISFFTNPNNVAALAAAYAQIYPLDSRNDGDNLIANAHAYNQNLLLLMQNIIVALEDAMYLDQLTVTVRDTVDIPKNAYLQNMALAVPIGLSGNKNFAADSSAINNYYYSQLQIIESNFLAHIVPEKKWVSQNALQTLEVDGKCTITGTDGQNNITASCPFYSDGGNGSIKTSYITSTLQRDKSSCTLQKETGDDSIMSVGDIRNINGYLGCVTGDTEGRFSFNNYSWFNVPQNEVNPRPSYGKYTQELIYTAVSGDTPITYVLGITDSRGVLIPFSFDGYSYDSPNSGETNYFADFSFDQIDKFGNSTHYIINLTNGDTEAMTALLYKNASVNLNYDPAKIVSYFGPAVDSKNNEIPFLITLKLNQYSNGATTDDPTEHYLSAAMPSGANQGESSISALNNILNQMNITIPPIPNNCEVRYIGQKTFPSISWNIGGYDSIKLGVYCQYGTYINQRTLLPGGIYTADLTTTHSFQMSNWQDWEVNNQTNPLIQSNAQPFSSIEINGYRNGDTAQFDNKFINYIKNSLTSQGRAEFAQTLQGSWNGWASVYSFNQTALYVPSEVNYDGYKTMAFWKRDGQLNGLPYGSTDSSFDLYQYNLNNNTYDSSCVNVFGCLRFDQFDNGTRIGLDNTL